MTEEKDYSEITEEAFIGTDLSSPLVISLDDRNIAVKGIWNWEQHVLTRYTASSSSTYPLVTNRSLDL